MEKKDILARELAGEVISLNDPEYSTIARIITKAQKLIAEINTGYHSPDETRALFARLTGVSVDASFWMLPPFYTDFGKNIRVGKNVFINHGCEFMDRGGITLEDNVLIGPKVNLVTINHPIDPEHRRSTWCAPIVIKKNAWIGAAVSVMPGVTIGENAIVAANSVVTKDVADNTIVAGTPARFIKTIEEAMASSAQEQQALMNGAVSAEA
ncbi:MAG: acetyltransferase [Oleibacter sp.]|mgnify:CR=1 FL=1|nr:acetyltransferase [Thalassolituus sp.]